MPRAKPAAPAAAPAAPVVAPAPEAPVDQPMVKQLAEAPAHVEQVPEVQADSALAAAPAQVKARVLVACELGQPDDVVEIDATDAKSLEGVVDTAPAAVKYAESLK